jgi:hypothetical protein
MHGAHYMRENSAIAHAGVEDAQRRRIGAQVSQLFGGAFSNLPFFVASIDEGEVFLPVVEKPERALRSDRRSALRGHAFSPGMADSMDWTLADYEVDRREM